MSIPIQKMGFGIATAGQILSALLLVALVCDGAYGGYDQFNRGSFPEGFIFGTGSSAYQYEGAVKEGGRGPSMWDTFTHIPGKIADGSNGDVAVDFYHRYKEDLNLLKDMNMDAFRFSISWGRILPTGSLSGGVNREGIDFYNKVINETIAKGLKPFVTLFHWDTPLALEKKYGGFLNENIVTDFRDYADVLFNEFGDRVQYWTTFNEPWTMCSYGYGSGAHAPGRCSPYVSKNCGAGDSSREPYTTAHHVLLAHGEAVRLYRQKYQAKQKGQIGITLVSHWFEPYSNSTADEFAVKRSLDFMFGWFLDPVVYGDYPETMKGWLSNRLPSFTPEQSKMLKGSYDFVGVNYYTTYYVVSVPPPNGLQQAYSTDARANQTGYRNGVAIGPPAYTPFLFMYPPGMRELLLYTKRRYQNPVIYVTENGVDEGNNSSLPLGEALKDDTRISYHRSHLSFIRLAIKDGVNVKGYFSWTFMDCFEWGDGYKDRFGLIFVDRATLQRHRKKSSHWFENFLRK